MDKWFKDILPDKNPYHNRGRDQMRKKGGSEFEFLWCCLVFSVSCFVDQYWCIKEGGGGGGQKFRNRWYLSSNGSWGTKEPFFFNLYLNGRRQSRSQVFWKGGAQLKDEGSGGPFMPPTGPGSSEVLAFYKQYNQRKKLIKMQEMF